MEIKRNYLREKKVNATDFFKKKITQNIKQNKMKRQVTSLKAI